MNPQDVYYIVASFATIVFLGMFTWLVIVLIKTLQIARRILEEIEDMSQNLSIVKEGFKVGILTFLGKLLGDKKEASGP